MDKRVAPVSGLLPALAEEIKLWFPELEGRALAVSEAEITKENVPTLPLVMVAFARSVSSQPANSAQFSIQMSDQIVVEFWMEPSRYKRQNGTETPFWSYYDYEAIRNVLLSHMVNWEGPAGERFAYREMRIEATPLAVVLTFMFLATFKWCADDTTEPPDGEPITDSTFDVKICAPASKICDPAFYPSEPEDPCP